MSRTLPQWVARKRSNRAASRAAHRSTAAPHPADSRTLTFDDLRDALRLLGPIPRRWMVRAADLEPHEDEALRRMMIPTRPERSHCLPTGALAVVFEGALFAVESMDWISDRIVDEGAKMTVIYRDGYTGARVGAE